MVRDESPKFWVALKQGADDWKARIIDLDDHTVKSVALWCYCSQCKSLDSVSKAPISKVEVSMGEFLGILAKEVHGSLEFGQRYSLDAVTCFLAAIGCSIGFSRNESQRVALSVAPTCRMLASASYGNCYITYTFSITHQALQVS